MVQAMSRRDCGLGESGAIKVKQVYMPEGS